MLITLKMLVRTLLLPPGGMLLLAAAGAWLIARRATPGARRAGWLLLIGALATLWLLATPVIAAALARLAQRYPALDLTQPLSAQAIVVLGGEGGRSLAQEYGGAPAAEGQLLERVVYAAFLARRTGLPVLVTGTADETWAMSATLARDFHIETRWVEKHSRDTFENAEFSAPLLQAAGVSRILLVTHADHEWRAAHEFASAGLSVVPAPVGIFSYRGESVLRYLPSPLGLEHSARALYEILGDWVRQALALLHLRRQQP
jgi:uncharacterized SAM-binding protein YcdF (DUF218 family)